MKELVPPQQAQQPGFDVRQPQPVIQMIRWRSSRTGGEQSSACRDRPQSG